MPAVIGIVAYEPIKAVRVLSQTGALPQLLRVAEAATQTFKIGVPTMLSGGYLTEWTTTGLNTLYGMSSEQAKNYTNAGGGANMNTLPPTIPPSIDLNDTAAGPPPNQPNAVVVPIGAALRDGQCGVYAANGQTVFSAALKTGQVFTQNLLAPGTYYALTKDATSGFWYVDVTTTVGNAAVVNLIGMDPSSPNDGVNGTRVFFQIVSNRRAFA